jgi:hypothetical protein
VPSSIGQSARQRAFFRPINGQKATSQTFAPRQSGIYLSAARQRRDVTPTGIGPGLVVLLMLAGFGLALGIGSLLIR